MYTQILLDKQSIVDPIDRSVFEIFLEFIKREASVVAEKSVYSAVKAIKRATDKQKWSDLLLFLKRNNRLCIVDRLMRSASSPYTIYLSDRIARSRALPDLDIMPIVDIIDLVSTGLRTELALEVTPIRVFHESKVRKVLLALGSRTLVPAGASAENIWLTYFSPFVGNSEMMLLCDRYMLEPTNIFMLQTFLSRLGDISYSGQLTLITKYWFDRTSSRPDHSRVNSDAEMVEAMYFSEGLAGRLIFQDDRVLRRLAHGRHLRCGCYGLDLDIGVETFCSPNTRKDAKIVKWLFDHDRCRQEEKLLLDCHMVGGHPAEFRSFTFP